MKHSLTIATRQSALAMQQANLIKTQLLAHYPKLSVRLLGLTTEGDRRLDQSLAKIGGKGLFVKELEKALLSGEADIAVHSMKDVPMELPAGLVLPCILNREDCRDVLVSNTVQSIADLPQGAIVGTSSVRRRAQLLALYPHLVIKSVRGNVQTRLRKLDEGQFDAIILAAAGLKRLGLEARIRDYFEVDHILPSPGQGALGIECRASDQVLIDGLSVLHDPVTDACVRAERQISCQLSASCQLPLAALATFDQEVMQLKGLVATPDGRQVIRSCAAGGLGEADQLAQSVADALQQQGALEILKACQ